MCFGSLRLAAKVNPIAAPCSSAITPLSHWDSQEHLDRAQIEHHLKSRGSSNLVLHESSMSIASCTHKSKKKKPPQAVIIITFFCIYFHVVMRNESSIVITFYFFFGGKVIR